MCREAIGKIAAQKILRTPEDGRKAKRPRDVPAKCAEQGSASGPMQCLFATLKTVCRSLRFKETEPITQKGDARKA